MKRRGFIQGLLGALPGAVVALREPSVALVPVVPQPVLVPAGLSVLGRATADGQVLRRVGGKLAFGTIDLADCDAVTGRLPLSNLGRA